MKKILFSMFFLMSTFVGYAQERQPMLKSGRIWNMHWSNSFYSGSRNHELKDTTVAGVDCYRDYCTGKTFASETGQFVSDYHQLGRCYVEEDGRVYVLNNNNKILLYDFTLEVGDKRVLSSSITQQVIWVDTILVRERYYRRLYLLETGISEKVPLYSYQNVVIWVEGVGSQWGLNKAHLDFQTTGGNEIFEALLDEEEGTLFTYNDFYAPPVHRNSLTGVESPMSPTPEALRPHAGNPLFDLQGRRLKQTPQKGIYIEDGKKKVVTDK